MSVEVEHLRSIVSPVRLARPPAPALHQSSLECSPFLAAAVARSTAGVFPLVTSPPDSELSCLPTALPVLHARHARPSVRLSVRPSDRQGCGETVFVAPA